MSKLVVFFRLDYSSRTLAYWEWIFVSVPKPINVQNISEWMDPEKTNSSVTLKNSDFFALCHSFLKILPRVDNFHWLQVNLYVNQHTCICVFECAHVYIYSFEVFIALQSEDFCFISSCFEMSFIFKDSLLNLKVVFPYLFLLWSSVLLPINIKQLLISTRIISLISIKVSSIIVKQAVFLLDCIRQASIWEQYYFKKWNNYFLPDARKSKKKGYRKYIMSRVCH